MPADGYSYDTRTGCWIAEGFDASGGSSRSDGTESHVRGVLDEVEASDYTAELASRIGDWPTRSHLSHLRTNLLEAVGSLIGPSWRALEFGDGTGALTRWLAGAVADVDVLEPSPERGAMTRVRAHDDNVRVLVGDPSRAPLPGEYDLVVVGAGLEDLMGLLGSTRPGVCLNALRRVREALRDGGILLLAADNRLGARYWAGCADARTGRLFDGPLGFPGDTSAAFSRIELEGLLREAGFLKQQFYHLYPDHRLPATVVREVDDLGEVAAHQWAQAFAQDCARQREYLMPDPLLLKSVEEAGLLWQFSDSFMVACSPSPDAALAVDWLIRKFSNSARPELAHTVTLTRRGGSLVVERTPLRGGQSTVDLGEYEFALGDGEYVAGSLLVTEAYGALASGRWFEGLTALCDELLEAGRTRFATEETARNGERPARGACGRGYGWLDGRALDFALWNLIRTADGSLQVIDTKWRQKAPVAADFMVFRSLYYVLSAGSPFVEAGLRETLVGLLGQFFPGFDDARLDELLEQERRFQMCVHANDPARVRLDEDGRLAVPTTGGSTLLNLARFEALLREEQAETARLQGELNAQTARLAESEARLSEAHLEAARLRAEIAAKRAQLAAVYESTSWRVSAPVRMAGRRVERLSRDPRYARARSEAAKLVRRFAPGLLARRETKPAVPRRVESRADPLLMAAEARRLAYRPTVSILVPVYNTPPHYLLLAVESVLAQAYPEWELCLCDDGSTSLETRVAVDELTRRDPRIRARFLEVNSGIATATNAALAMAQGEFVAMLDHDDELLPDALLEVVKVLNTDRALDVVYTDQDYMAADGTVDELFHKPDWSLEMFRGVMYVGHLLVVRRSLAEGVHGFDPAFDNVQDFEFMLRLAERTERIAHVPKVLYHWRRIPGSVAFGGDEKRDIEPRQAAAVNAHLQRCGIPALARPNPNHAHRLLISPRPRADRPRVSVVVRAAEAEAQLEGCLERVVSAGSYPALELIIAGGDLPADLMRRLEGRGVAVEAPGASGGAACLAGLRRASGHLIVSMAADLVVETPEWLNHLLLDCELPGVACVAPMVLSPGGDVESAGLILDPEEVVRPAMRGWRPESDGHAGSLSCVREVSAVPADCFAVSREVLEQLGGPTPYFATDAAVAADLSIRAVSRGLRNLCTPRVVVRRQSPAAAGGEADALDRLLLLDAWGPLISRGDPYWNPNHGRDRPVEA